jgi:hypothetical protein
LCIFGRCVNSSVVPVASQLERLQPLRDEAALSRLYGGIYFRSDIEVGKDHGARIGGCTVRFAQGDGAN